MIKKDILDWYCEVNAKTFGLCATGFRNCGCKGKEKLSNMLDELIENQRDYSYKTIEEYEELVGYKVGDAFKTGWAMARTRDSYFKKTTKGEGG